MKHITLIGSLILAGCANSAPIYTETGALGYTVDCSGLARNWGQCEAKAGELCKSAGYAVLSRTDQRQPALLSGDHSVSDMFSSAQVERSMTIRCNAPQTASK